MDEEGRDCVSLRSKKFNFEGTVCYHSKLKRIIAMESPEMPPGIVNKINFGFPGPDILYRSQTAKGWKEEK